MNQVPSSPDHVTIHVDGREVAVPAGANLVEACASIGVEIPHYCYHPHLSVVGNCRMCLVEMGMPMKDRTTGQDILDEQGRPKVGWMPKPVIACATKAAPGMHVRTQSKLVSECRHGVMEFLLVNHPLDCPVCDQAGECRLQEFATDYGRGYSRFVEDKNVKPKRTRLGPRVMLDDERCILCSRCIRFCKEVDQQDVLGFIDRGSYSTLTCFPGKELDSNYSLNTVDLCPVGALTSVDFRFRMRVWFLKPVASICTESSVGVNTEVWSREGRIYRITPRRNDAVNDTWMSDSGRALYKLVDSDARLLHYCVDGAHKSFEQNIEHAVRLLKGGQVAYVGNGHMTLEEQARLNALRAVAGGEVHYVSHTREGDGFLISADSTPNVRGALLTGLLSALPTPNLAALGRAIDAGEVRTLLVHGEDLLQGGLSTEQMRKVKVIYIGTHCHATTEKAEIVFPGLSVFEKEGSFVNQQFRLQRFQQAVPGPTGIRPEVAVYAALHAGLSGGRPVRNTPAEVWDSLAQEVPELRGLSWAGIPATGQPLDSSRFAALPFCEGPSLHYAPQAPAAGESVRHGTISP